ncbi:DUF3108 domain-containing protein [Ferrimonas sp. SCSIO 43195]|uniref:DUF3108 domain-containing protein n=1 Tax=Ferrimonas sp. SCSIO 43195 TaxID=2822844 RepID=UPI00207554FE|nr:DUF3108 domain-containing protein [Ferrimonas sp. SCSIO 43195]USD36442.1 DUF3108 domain-containing protein [Ferrimonas sp. SCSIO 43195]
MNAIPEKSKPSPYRLLLIGLLLTPTLQAQQPAPFIAHYQATSKGLPCGGGSQQLVIDDGQYQLLSKGKFCLLGGRVDNRSLLSWQQGRWQTLAFDATVSGWFSQDDYQASRTPEGLMAVNKDGHPLVYEEHAPASQGAATMLQNLALDVERQRQDLYADYTWGDETRDYRFEWLGEEQIEFDGRAYRAHHLRQTHPKKSRVADFWFAPALEHQLIKMTVHRLGIKMLDVRLSDFERSDPITR